MHFRKDSRKGVAIDGVPIKKASELVGLLNVVMFAPEGSVYKKLQGVLNRSIFTPVIPLGGMKDIDFTDIIKTLCASASAV